MDDVSIGDNSYYDVGCSTRVVSYSRMLISPEKRSFEGDINIRDMIKVMEDSQHRDNVFVNRSATEN